jgi:hypothetical protein
VKKLHSVVLQKPGSVSPAPWKRFNKAELLEYFDFLRKEIIKLSLLDKPAMSTMLVNTQLQ